MIRVTKGTVVEPGSWVETAIAHLNEAGVDGVLLDEPYGQVIRGGGDDALAMGEWRLSLKMFACCGTGSGQRFAIYSPYRKQGVHDYPNFRYHETLWNALSDIVEAVEPAHAAERARQAEVLRKRLAEEQVLRDRQADLLKARLKALEPFAKALEDRFQGTGFGEWTFRNVLSVTGTVRALFDGDTAKVTALKVTAYIPVGVAGQEEAGALAGRMVSLGEDEANSVEEDEYD